MRIIVTKPRQGRVNIRVADRRGATGQVWVSKDVLVEDVKQVAGSMLEVWETKRKAIKDARRQGKA